MSATQGLSCARLTTPTEPLMTWSKKLKTTWRNLNSRLSSLSEDEVFALLEEELSGPRRASMILRLHQRGNTLRVMRERIELLKEATTP
jgi:hypothetical protein